MLAYRIAAPRRVSDSINAWSAALRVQCDAPGALVRLVAPILLLVACSDYDLNQQTGKDGRPFDSGEFNTETGEGGEEDTWVDDDPSVCQDRDILAGTLPLNEECFGEADPVGTFTPIVEWTKDSWSVQPASVEVMMMPAVGSLSDDDGDGDADEDDIPDIVVITYSPNCIRAVSGDGSGTELLNICDNSVQGQGGVALGDIDGDGWTDIIAATTGGVVAYDHTGTKMWTNNGLSGHIYGTSDNPAISDMDGDGNPEIIMGSGIIDNKGKTIAVGSHGMGGVAGNNVGTTSFAVDIDGDGAQEVVTGNALYKRDGSVIWFNGQTDGYPAVGNFDADDKAEIVVSTGGKVRLQDDDGTVLCTASIPGASSAYYGGPPTVGDFDGDGQAEFACAAGSRYSVFESDCKVKWQATTQDASSGNTGSSVFDFEGDGSAEAVYADETRLWVFDGATGSVKLESTQHSNATWLEYPAIADVDGDDHAEIVVANTSGKHGFYVFGDADNSWRPGRRIWNQHAYHITNVNDDGSIPKNADRNWLTYNSFRSGDLDAATDGFVMPDLVTEVEDVCTDECAADKLEVWVSIGNQGYEDIRADVSVQLMGVMKDGSEQVLGEESVTDTIASATRMAALHFEIQPIPGGLKSVYSRVDGGNESPDSDVTECDETNNEDPWKENLCPP